MFLSRFHIREQRLTRSQRQQLHPRRGPGVALSARPLDVRGSSRRSIPSFPTGDPLPTGLGPRLTVDVAARVRCDGRFSKRQAAGSRDGRREYNNENLQGDCIISSLLKRNMWLWLRGLAGGGKLVVSMSRDTVCGKILFLWILRGRFP